MCLACGDCSKEHPYSVDDSIDVAEATNLLMRKSTTGTATALPSCL